MPPRTSNIMICHVKLDEIVKRVTNSFAGKVVKFTRQIVTSVVNKPLARVHRLTRREAEYYSNWSQLNAQSWRRGFGRCKKQTFRGRKFKTSISMNESIAVVLTISLLSFFISHSIAVFKLVCLSTIHKKRVLFSTARRRKHFIYSRQIIKKDDKWSEDEIIQRLATKLTV